jgi:hypothetical protein
MGMRMMVMMTTATTTVLLVYKHDDTTICLLNLFHLPQAATIQPECGPCVGGRGSCGGGDGSGGGSHGRHRHRGRWYQLSGGTADLQGSSGGQRDRRQGLAMVNNKTPSWSLPSSPPLSLSSGPGFR